MPRLTRSSDAPTILGGFEVAAANAEVPPLPLRDAESGRIITFCGYALLKRDDGRMAVVFYNERSRTVETVGQAYQRSAAMTRRGVEDVATWYSAGHARKLYHSCVVL